MAVTQVRALINGTWYNLALDSATGKYFVDLTPTAISSGQPGGYFSATVEASSNAAPTVTLSGADYPGLRLVVEDTVAPTLTVTAPANGLVTAAESITVTGTAFDTSGIASVTVNGKAVTVAADGKFSAAVSLSGGSNTITIVATDTSGNAATATRTVTRATSGPALTITSPAAGALVQTASVTVSGTVSDRVSPVVAVKVNGTAAVISGSTWTATVPLVEGANTLTAVATNQVGLSTTVTRSVTRDSTAPVLTVTAPADNLVTAAEEVTVSGTVTDTGAVTVKVNGTAVTLAGGAFSVTVPLAGGRNTITVTAEDAAGNVSTAARTVVRATQGPAVTILSPESGFVTNENTILVTGTVSDSVALVSGVTVNGVSAALSSGAFSATVPLTEGSNSLTVVGVNSVGLSTTKTVSGTLDTIPPEISITSPTAGQMVSAAAFPVTGTVSDGGSGLAGVTVNGKAAAVSGGEFSLQITLAEGANAITATATDNAGNTADATGSVLLDTIRPALTVDAPAGNLITNQPRLTVAGTVSDGGSGVDAVTVNGQPVEAAGGTFSTVLTLEEGSNAVTVSAVDKVGNGTTITRSVLLDTAPPVLTLVSPPEGFIKDSQPTVVFSVVDEPGGSGVNLDTVVVLLDGVAQTGASVTSGTISFTPAEPLADGPHVITVTVEDLAGNQRGLSASYTVDTVPPVLYLKAPYQRHVVDDEAVEIVVEAWDGGSGVAMVTAGGQALTKEGTSTYKGVVTLAIGENTFSIAAADQAGNTTTAQLYMIRLVTDRTKADVEFLRGLYDKNWEQWPEDAKAWFLQAVCLRGSYDVSDWNRVGVAVRWLSGELQRRGYIADTSPKTDWTEDDDPTHGRMAAYLQDVETVRSAQNIYVQEIPETLRFSTFEEWNNIEKALVEVDEIFPRYTTWTSGEISCGES